MRKEFGKNLSTLWSPTAGASAAELTKSKMVIISCRTEAVVPPYWTIKITLQI